LQRVQRRTQSKAAQATILSLAAAESTVLMVVKVTTQILSVELAQM